ncbi:hypothetical protein [Parashewanella tropica]|uniref:hypothetical protein n=1 Tax=Parashewanella tropica TaxID=2547970 RepID=UPI00105978DB|nr:hypothetical protein [Parashewanella tropica]
MKTGLYQLSVGVFTSLLVGCGGGSSGDKSQNGGNQGSQIPTEYVTATTLYSSKCGINAPASGVRFFTHGRDGNVLKEYKSDANGKISIPWNDKTKHLTVLMEDKLSESKSKIALESELELQPVDLGTYFVFDYQKRNTNCECKDFTFNFGEVINLKYPNYRIRYDERDFIQGPTDNYLRTKEFCKIDGKYKTIALSAQNKTTGSTDFAATLDLNQHVNDNTIVIPQSIFTGEEHVGTRLSINSNVQLHDIYTFAETEQGRKNRVFGGNIDTTQFFPKLFEHNYLNGKHRVSQSSDIGRFTYSSNRRIKLDKDKTSYDLDLTLNQNQMLGQVQQIFQGLTSDSATNYNFRNLGEGHNAFIFELSNNNFSWQLRAPLQGVIPDMDLPEDVRRRIVASGPANSLDAFVYGYFYDGNFNDFRKKLADIRKQNLKIRSSFFDNYVNQVILLDIDN